jgi:nucleotide-binding universal stress UspA family protein
LLAAGGFHVERAQDFAQQVVFLGYLSGGLAQQLLGGAAEQRAGHGISEDNAAVFVQQQQAFVEAAHDAGGAVALGQQLGHRGGAVLLQLHQHAVEGLGYAAIFIGAFDGNGGGKILLGSVLQAVGEVA